MEKQFKEQRIIESIGGIWKSTAQIARESGINYYDTLDILIDLNDRLLVDRLVRAHGRWNKWRNYKGEHEELEAPTASIA